jgi:hypothetical protein
MGRLEDIESAAGRVAGRLRTFEAECERTLAELENLRAASIARDEEAVRAAQIHMRELEDAREEVFCSERRLFRTESAAQDLSGRLAALVRPRKREKTAEVPS